LPTPLIACIDPARWGHVAEWLRSGLQNRLHQFNSGRGLQQYQSLKKKSSSRSSLVSDSSARTGSSFCGRNGAKAEGFRRGRSERHAPAMPPQAPLRASGKPARPLRRHGGSSSPSAPRPTFRRGATIAIARHTSMRSGMPAGGRRLPNGTRVSLVLPG
jgi:hypothetical protein